MKKINKGYALNSFTQFIDNHEDFAPTIKVNDGWYRLLNLLCKCITEIDDEAHPTQIIQIAQKFGNLRFYVGKAPSGVYGAIKMASEISRHICEQCGSTDNVNVVRDSDGTMYSKCKQHRRQNA